MTRKKISPLVIGAIILVSLYFVLLKLGILKKNGPLSKPVAGVPSVVGSGGGLNIMSESPQSIGYTWVSVAPTETYGPNRSIYKGPGGDFVVW
jgi:hypothetical protein